MLRVRELIIRTLSCQPLVLLWTLLHTQCAASSYVYVCLCRLDTSWILHVVDLLGVGSRGFACPQPQRFFFQFHSEALLLLAEQVLLEGRSLLSSACGDQLQDSLVGSLQE